MKLVEIHAAIAQNTACLQRAITDETRRRQIHRMRREHLAGMIELAQTVHRFHPLDALVLMIEALKDMHAVLALEDDEDDQGR